MKNTTFIILILVLAVFIGNTTFSSNGIYMKHPWLFLIFLLGGIYIFFRKKKLSK